MKYLLFLNLLFISCSLVKKQTATVVQPLKEISLNKKKLYIVCRGTYSKSTLIADKFNIKDRNITHCGIGFIKNNGFFIYNVSDIKSDKSCLIIDSFNSFRNPSGVYYLSIWECNVNGRVLKSIIKACEDYAQRKINFDYSFTLDDSNSLYCSEFCARILNDTKPEKFNFKPLQLHLKNEFYETILKREVFIYFPVDFFEENKEFKKIYEWQSSK